MHRCWKRCVRTRKRLLASPYPRLPGHACTRDRAILRHQHPGRLRQRPAGRTGGPADGLWPQGVFGILSHRPAPATQTVPLFQAEMGKKATDDSTIPPRQASSQGSKRQKIDWPSARLGPPWLLRLGSVTRSGRSCGTAPTHGSEELHDQLALSSGTDPNLIAAELSADSCARPQSGEQGLAEGRVRGLPLRRQRCTRSCSTLRLRCVGH